MNKRDQLYVNTLCKWITVKIAPSPVHGIGIFAIKDMPKGTKLFADIMPEIFQLDYKVLRNNTPEYVHDAVVQAYPRAAKGEAFVYPLARWAAFMNHSDDPNYDAIEDVLLKPVKAGDEIFEDYRKIPGWEEVFDWLQD